MKEYKFCLKPIVLINISCKLKYKIFILINNFFIIIYNLLYIFMMSKFNLEKNRIEVIKLDKYRNLIYKDIKKHKKLKLNRNLSFNNFGICK